MLETVIDRWTDLVTDWYNVTETKGKHRQTNIDGQTQADKHTEIETQIETHGEKQAQKQKDKIEPKWLIQQTDRGANAFSCNVRV